MFLVCLNFTTLYRFPLWPYLGVSLQSSFYDTRSIEVNLDWFCLSSILFCSYHCVYNLSVCLCLYTCLCLSTYLLCLHTCLCFVFVYSIHVCQYLSIHLYVSICQYTFLCLSLIMYLFMSIFIRLPVNVHQHNYFLSLLLFSSPISNGFLQWWVSSLNKARSKPLATFEMRSKLRRCSKRSEHFNDHRMV